MSDGFENDAGTAMAEVFLCKNCLAPLNEGDVFCRQCGSKHDCGDGDEATEKKWNNLQQIILFFLISAFICSLGSFIKYFHTIGWLTMEVIMLACLSVVFVIINWRSCRKLLSWRNFSLLRLIWYCFLAVAASFTVSFIVDWLNESLFHARQSYYDFFASYKNGTVLTIIYIAIIPALFEELGFRVFLIEKLLAVTEKKQAIFISAFMFAVIHMSFLSLFWLFPFGLLLAYIRIKEGTMWYGSFIHFFFNLTTCGIDILQATHHH